MVSEFKRNCDQGSKILTYFLPQFKHTSHIHSPFISYDCLHHTARHVNKSQKWMIETLTCPSNFTDKSHSPREQYVQYNCERMSGNVNGDG